MKHKRITTIAGLLLVGFSQTSFAAPDTWSGQHEYDMYNGGQNIDYKFDGSDSAVTVGGVNVQVSVWSDTGGANDNKVENQGRLNRYGDGYGLLNKDYDRCRNSGYSHNTCEVHVDQHTMDNRVENAWGSDFDMMLLSFSSLVTLTGASFSYVEGDLSLDKEVTVVGLSNDTLFDGNTDFTWNDVQAHAVDGALGHFSIGDVTSGIYTSAFTGMQSAQYWLVGAYNTFFDETNATTNTGFKISSLGFNKPPTPDQSVPGPNAFALMLAGGAMLAWRKKRAKQY